MNHLYIGKVPSHACGPDAEVLTIGREAIVKSAREIWRRGDPLEVEDVLTPRFDVDWIPEGVLSLGDVHQSSWGGPFVEFAPHLEQTLIALLSQLGLQVVVDHALLREAEGYERDQRPDEG